MSSKLRFGRNCLLDLIGIEIEGIPSAVHQHWPGLEIQPHLRRRRKGHGRN
jgi:hypothetical protein